MRFAHPNRTGGSSDRCPLCANATVAPSGQFFTNASWLACAVLAHNLIRWTTTIGDITPNGELTVARTVRTRLIAIPGRLVNRSGTRVLRLPTRWPWAENFTHALIRLRAVPQLA